jgi:hypothetical protein
MHGDGQGARGPARQAEVDRVVKVWADSREIRPEGHRFLISGELTVVSAPRAGKLVPARRKGQFVEAGVQEKGQSGIEALRDQAAEQASRVRTDPSPGARTLQRPHIQQNPR